MSGEEHIIHDTDWGLVGRNMGGLFGRVQAKQDDAIADRLCGERILDVGAGAGTLTKHLRERGFEVEAIDIDPEAIAAAREITGVTVREESIYATTFAAGAFDAVVFRESIAHLDVERALTEVDRICGRQVVIFESNPENQVLQLARRLIGHEEYNEQPPAHYATALRRRGYQVRPIHYLDTLSIPVSGGNLTRPLPLAQRLGRAVLLADGLATRASQAVGLDRDLCWRYLIDARRPA